MKTQRHRTSGLSVLEILLVVATVGLLGLAFLPMMAKPRSYQHGSRISCVNNLKQIGLACRLWSNDNNDEFPWVSTNANGSHAVVNSPQVFQHFAAMSNELVTPKILVCPNDTQRIKAANFAQLSNINLSYFIALDADETKPQRLLSGDRNITGGTLSNGFLHLIPAVPQPSVTPVGWTVSIHNNAGNVGLSDGSVQQVTPVSLQKHLQTQDLPVIRLVIP